jgi:hypothetical protein
MTAPLVCHLGLRISLTSIIDEAIGMLAYHIVKWLKTNRQFSDDNFRNRTKIHTVTFSLFRLFAKKGCSCSQSQKQAIDFLAFVLKNLRSPFDDRTKYKCKTIVIFFKYYGCLLQDKFLDQKNGS